MRPTALIFRVVVEGQRGPLVLHGAVASLWQFVHIVLPHIAELPARSKVSIAAVVPKHHS